MARGRRAAGRYNGFHGGDSRPASIRVDLRPSAVPKSFGRAALSNVRLPYMTGGMPRQPLDVLRTVFGFDAFRGQQAEIVEHVVAGGDALVLMPTGGGKSLCYQVPALCRDGVAIVVSPLIALMRDQVEV